MWKNIVRLAFALLLAWSVELNAQSLHTLQVGTRVVGAFQLGISQVPLPEGVWTLAGRGEPRGHNNTGPITLAEVWLVEALGGKVSRAIYARALIGGASNSSGWVRSRSVCDRNDVFKGKYDQNYSPIKSNCFIANHVVAVRPADVDRLILGQKDFYSYMKTNNLDWPETHIGTSHALNDRTPFLIVNYMFNSEVIGIDAGVADPVATPSDNWRKSEWHKDRIGADQGKVNIMSKIYDFGEAMTPLLERGLLGQLKIGEVAPVMVPGWPMPK